MICKTIQEDNDGSHFYVYIMYTFISIKLNLNRNRVSKLTFSKSRNKLTASYFWILSTFLYEMLFWWTKTWVKLTFGSNLQESFPFFKSYSGKIKFSTFFNFQYNTVFYFVFCIFRCFFCKAYIFMVSLKCFIEYYINKKKFFYDW